MVKTVTRTRGGSSWKDREEIAYDADTRLPVSKITHTGTAGDKKTGETRWTYDANGNITSEKTRPYNVTDFLETSYTYDPTGRYLATTTDALGQTTACSDYDKYGNARKITDHRGQTTVRAFDVWGRADSTRFPDGSCQKITREWRYGTIRYRITESITGKPSSKVGYDPSWSMRFLFACLVVVVLYSLVEVVFFNRLFWGRLCFGVFSLGGLFFVIG